MKNNSGAHLVVVTQRTVLIHISSFGNQPSVRLFFRSGRSCHLGPSASVGHDVRMSWCSLFQCTCTYALTTLQC